MSQAEYESWLEFYRSYPFDDVHRYYRPAALGAWALRGGEIKPLLDWLQGGTAGGAVKGFSPADEATIAALGGVPPKRKG